MWSSRRGGAAAPGPNSDDDTDSIFGALDDPVTRLEPLLPAAATGAKSVRLYPSLPPRLAVDRYGHLKPQSFGQRARRAAHRFWPAALASASDDGTSSSVPSDTMSLSTITNSSISDRSSLIVPSTRAAPWNSAKPQCSSITTANYQDVSLDPDAIIQSLLTLDLCDGEIDDLAGKLARFAAAVPLPQPIIMPDTEIEPDTESEPEPCNEGDEDQESKAAIPSQETGPPLQMDADNDTAGLPDTPLQGNRNPLSKDHHTQKHPAEQNPANLNFTEDHLPGEHSSHETSTDKDPTKSLSDGDIRTEDLGNQDHTTEEHPEITASCGEEGVDRDCSSPISLVDLFNEDIISNIGTYAVQQAFGPEFHGIIPSSALNEAVEELISNLAAFIVDSDDVRTHFTGRSEGDGTHGHAAPTSGGGKSSLKRKATGGDGVESGGQGGGNGDDGGDGMSGDGSGRRNGKHTPPANIKDLGHGRFEFMCPFRLKDPLRFNVRDWYDCATKVYVCEESSSKRNELNELRRHLKLKHARPGAPSPPYCSKCKEEFPTEMRLDDHAKQETCTYRELFMSNDPLDGLTQDAERELSSKQGRQGASAMTQYRQICHIVLGADSEVPSPGYLPVIEHFELHQHHIESLPTLRSVFLRKLPIDLAHQVDGLLDEMHHHTIDIFQQCTIRAPATTGHKRRKITHRRMPKPKGPQTHHVREGKQTATTSWLSTPTTLTVDRDPPDLMRSFPEGLEGASRAALATLAPDFEGQPEWSIISKSQPQPPSLSSPGSSNDLNYQDPYASTTLSATGVYPPAPVQEQAFREYHSVEGSEPDRLFHHQWYADLAEFGILNQESSVPPVLHTFDKVCPQIQAGGYSEITWQFAAERALSNGLDGAQTSEPSG